MIAHHVLFWLKADTTETQKANFRKGLDSLEHIEVVQYFHIGTPAPIERAVVDTTYTFSLVLFLKIWPVMTFIRAIRSIKLFWMNLGSFSKK